MAYVNKEKKAKINAALKEIMPKEWKWSLAVSHHSTIVLTIRSAPVNLMEIASRFDKLNQYTYVEVNTHRLEQHFEGELLALFKKIVAALNTDNHDNSDPMTDYFDVGHYVRLQIGKWDKPFRLHGEQL